MNLFYVLYEFPFVNTMLFEKLLIYFIIFVQLDFCWIDLFLLGHPNLDLRKCYFNKIE